MLRGFQSRVAEEGTDGSQPQVATTGAVVTVFLQLIQELEDHGHGEVGQGELRRRSAQALLDELQEQTEGVAIGGDGMRAGPPLGQQTLGEEALQQYRQVSRGLHRSPFHRCSSRAPAACIKAGVLLRYQ